LAGRSVVVVVAPQMGYRHAKPLGEFAYAGIAEQFRSFPLSRSNLQPHLLQTGRSAT